MTYSIWLEPAESDKKHLLRIIRELSSKYDAPMFDPHITLYGRIQRLDAAKKAVLRCCGLPKIRASVKKIRHSNYLWKTLYADIEPSAELCSIHNVLKRGLKTRYEFKPHVSLIYKKLPTRTKIEIRKTISIKQDLKFDKITAVISSPVVDDWRRRFGISLG